jgi:protein phosphatase
VEEMVRLGEITREEARIHPDKNIITRAIGVSERVEPDYFDTTLDAGECLLLCSDGLTNMLKDEEIKAILDEGANLRIKTAELVMAANGNGGKDNIAVILVEQE